MKDQIRSLADSGQRQDGPAQCELDVVVPFTDPAMTRVALAAVGRLSAGLQAAVRLVRVQLVPYPGELNRSPVAIDFLHEQLDSLRPEFPLKAEVRLARELLHGVVSTLHSDSVVVLASKKRIWRTKTERLAADLRHAGFKTVVIYEGDANA